MMFSDVNMSERKQEKESKDIGKKLVEEMPSEFSGGRMYKAKTK